jgi:methyl-accepting chemotaxis protein
VRKVLKDVLELTFIMATSSEEMSSAVTSFSENIQNQAASAEEITATVEQVAGGFDGIAKGTMDQYNRMSGLIQKMDELSRVVTSLEEQTMETQSQTGKISVEARSREESLNLMSKSMEKISVSSHEMKNIINIINDISDKINLLSLNAAIEAARACDYGRGFAVVADEISKLADQTANSIKDISTLIQENDREMGKGMANARDTVQTINSIIHGVSLINDMMGKITQSMTKQIEVNNEVNREVNAILERSDEMKTATDEQKIAFDEIVQSISNINLITQSNASSAEELASGSEEIAGNADTVKKEVEFFKV